jgi:hypothetical protein
VASARTASAAMTVTVTIEIVRMIFCTGELRRQAVRVSRRLVGPFPSHAPPPR